MRIALDFDGVLHDAKAIPVPGQRMGPPVEGALRAVKHLRAYGHVLCVYTVRAGKPTHVHEWLAYHGFPNLMVCDSKPDADVYLDDKAIRFVDWDHALSLIEYSNAP